jgi:hypothetical protein
MAEVNDNHVLPPPAATDAPQNQDNKDVQMADADLSQGEQQPTVCFGPVPLQTFNCSRFYFALASCALVIFVNLTVTC